MARILDILGQQLGEEDVQRISRQVGADEANIKTAIAAALPMIIGGLSRNTKDSSEGAQSLSTALERDHDGSLLGNLSSLLGGSGAGGAAGGLLGAAGALLGGGEDPQGKGATPRATDGDGILRHVFGEKRSAVERGVSRASGLDSGTVGKLLSMLAPVVMDAVGKAKKREQLDAGGVSRLLDEERAEIEREAPDAQQGNLLAFLDSNDDGRIEDDVAKLGAAAGGAFLVSRLFRGRG